MRARQQDNGIVSRINASRFKTLLDAAKRLCFGSDARCPSAWRNKPDTLLGFYGIWMSSKKRPSDERKQGYWQHGAYPTSEAS
jgi:hypothetical protein